MANASALKAAFAKAVAGFTTAEVRARLEAEDVPHAVVLTREQVETDPQVVHNGILTVTDHPAAGRLRETLPPAKFAATPSTLRRHAPLLGEQTDEILKDLGRDAAEIAALRAAGVAG